MQFSAGPRLRARVSPTGHFLGRKKVTKERRLRGRIPIPQPAKGSGTCASPPLGNPPLGDGGWGQGEWRRMQIWRGA